MLLFVVVALFCRACPAADERPRYVIQRAALPITIDGRLDESSWFAAKEVGTFRFAWWKAGTREATIAKMLWDDEYLYVAYLCHDAHISAQHVGLNQPVWTDDCVEVFTAPDPKRPDAYFNIEMNANGAVFDDYHPRGVGSDIRPRWSAEGLKIATRIHGTLNNDADQDQCWTLEVAIPFKAFVRVAPHLPPKPGDEWRLNLNRCGGKVNEQFSQWSPGTGPEPQFHAPRDFGTVRFSDERAPF
jgi:hypothetical protein